MSRRNLGDLVYLVAWPDGVIKVGMTSRLRHRTFLSRGASLGGLWRCDGVAHAISIETEMARALRGCDGARPAFKSRLDARADGRLSDGGGYLECVKVDAPDAALAMLASIPEQRGAGICSDPHLKQMPKSDPEQCLRTDGRTYGDALPTSSCISPVVTRAISSIDEGCE